MRDRRAVTSAKNGKKGGRPPKDKGLEDFAGVGPPPTHPLKLARWAQSVLAIDMYRQVQGRADETLSSELRATAGAIARTIPADIMVEAMKLIREDNEATTTDEEDVELEELSAEEQRAGSVYCPAPGSRTRQS